MHGYYGSSYKNLWMIEINNKQCKYMIKYESSFCCAGVKHIRNLFLLAQNYKNIFFR